MKNGYLITYDISDSKIRSKVFETLKDFGMRHIQESVFWGALRAADVNAIAQLLREACVGDNDRALFVPMTIADIEKSILINYPDGTFRLNEYQIC